MGNMRKNSVKYKPQPRVRRSPRPINHGRVTPDKIAENIGKPTDGTHEEPGKSTTDVSVQNFDVPDIALELLQTRPTDTLNENSMSLIFNDETAVTPPRKYTEAMLSCTDSISNTMNHVDMKQTIAETEHGSSTKPQSTYREASPSFSTPERKPRALASSPTAVDSVAGASTPRSTVATNSETLLTESEYQWLEDMEPSHLLTHLRIPLIELANNVKHIQLPSHRWHYKVTLYEMPETVLARCNPIIYTGDIEIHQIAEDQRAKYQPSSVLFKRRALQLDVSYDRMVIFQCGTYFTIIDDEPVSLIAAPAIISKISEVEILLSIIDDLTLHHSYVQEQFNRGRKL